jgi:hypothetical protein
MKMLCFLIINTIFCFEIVNAQDSLKSIKKTKWCLSFTIDNNYNFRYVRVPSGKDNSAQKWDYLDTCNIACSMKSFSIKFDRKIWKFLGLQSGLTYGRKGYMGCRTVAFNDIGISRLYYTSMPLTNITVPIGLVFNKSALKNKLFLSMNTGMELNFNDKEYDRYDRKGNIEYEKQGFFGFRSLKNTDNKTPYEPNEQGILGFAQYYLGFNLKFKIFNATYITAEYNYVSDFKFYEVTEYLHVRTYAYERKSYIHRYGGGIGFMF